MKKKERSLPNKVHGLSQWYGSCFLHCPLVFCTDIFFSRFSKIKGGLPAINSTLYTSTFSLQHFVAFMNYACCGCCFSLFSLSTRWRANLTIRI